MEIKGYTTNINAGYAVQTSLKYKQFIKNFCINLYKKTKMQ